MFREFGKTWPWNHLKCITSWDREVRPLWRGDADFCLHVDQASPSSIERLITSSECRKSHTKTCAPHVGLLAGSAYFESYISNDKLHF